jgi:hypothetical protein
MVNEFTEKRSERRSFYCPNKLWEEILRNTKDCYSVSTFIQMAVKEKLKE